MAELEPMTLEERRVASAVVRRKVMEYLRGRDGAYREEVRQHVLAPFLARTDITGHERIVASEFDARIAAEEAAARLAWEEGQTDAVDENGFRVEEHRSDPRFPGVKS
jgi:hypothetical protein